MWSDWFIPAEKIHVEFHVIFKLHFGTVHKEFHVEFSLKILMRAKNWYNTSKILELYLLTRGFF